MEKHFPDDCVTKIFEHLSTPEAVEACCCLKKWIDSALWAHVPIFSFDITDAYEKAGPTEPRSVTRARFADRITTAFLKRDAVAKEVHFAEFRLVFHFADNGKRNDEVRSWVRSAVSLEATTINLRFTKHSGGRARIVDEDFIDIDSFEDIDEPRDFWFHFSDIQDNKVEELRLDNAHFELMDALDLSTLQKMWLSDVHSQSDADISNLISLCSNLREFSFQRALLGVQAGRVKIHSNTLQILSWRSISYYEDQMPLQMVLSIEAPALISLTLFGFEGESYNFYLPSLVEADIECYFKNRSQTACEALQYVAQRIYGVERLRFQNTSIHNSLTKFQGLHDHPVYINLKVFEILTGYHEKEIVELSLFLRASPLLETLVLNYKYNEAYCTDTPYYSNLGTSQWFASRCSTFIIPSLKRVVLRNYQKTRNETYTVELLKKSRLVLESILVIPPKYEGCKRYLWSANPDEMKKIEDGEADQ